MGAHHFKLDLVPRGHRPQCNEDGTYHGDFLLGFELSTDILQRLRSLLPKPNHWGNVEEFNSISEWGSDLRIWHADDGRIESVVMRYAPVGDPNEVLQKFVRIVKDAGCDLLVQSTFEIVPPEFDAVFAALRQHHAFRFLENPEGAIHEAARQNPENKLRGGQTSRET